MAGGPCECKGWPFVCLLVCPSLVPLMTFGQAITHTGKTHDDVIDFGRGRYDVLVISYEQFMRHVDAINQASLCHRRLSVSCSCSLSRAVFVSHADARAYGTGSVGGSRFHHL